MRKTVLYNQILFEICNLKTNTDINLIAPNANSLHICHSRRGGDSDEDGTSPYKLRQHFIRFNLIFFNLTGG